MSDAEELQRLRARVAQLEAGRPDRPPRRVPVPGAAARRWRAFGSALLLTLACLLAPLSVVAVWASTQLSDTDRYVETVSPLIEDPAIQADLTAAVTREIFNYVDLNSLTDDALGAIDQLGLPQQATDALQALQGPVVQGAQEFVRSRVQQTIATPEFASVWDRANEIAHTQLLNVLDGNQSGAVSAQNDTVTVNLGPIIAQVKDRLVADGFALAANIPDVNATYELVQSGAVTQAQTAYRVLTALAAWLPLLTLVLAVAGVLAARRRSRAVVATALGVAGAMLALGAGLVITRIVYLDALPGAVLSRDSAGTVYDTIVRFLRDGLRVVAVLALIVAIAAFFVGSSASARRARAATSTALARLRGSAEGAGMKTGRFGAFVYRHKKALWAATVLLGALVLVFWTRPSIAVVVTIALVVLAGVVIIEFLGRPPVPASVAATPNGRSAEPVAHDGEVGVDGRDGEVGADGKGMLQEH